MLKKTMTYTDYNGNERTEDFYFNLSKAELYEMEMSVSGGFVEMVHNIIKAQDTPTLIKLFKDVILKAYGVKSPDGRQFIKVDDNGRRLADNFAQTEAYSDLYVELATNDKAAADFINGVIPESVKNKTAAVPASN